MAAIITDQLRILNASNFIAGVASTSNSYYTFVGLPNPQDYQSDWDVDPPSPIDNFSNYDDYWDTAIGLKRISDSDIRQVIRRNTWRSGVTYDMYRHDINVNRLSQPSNTADLYSSNYYIVNSDYRVYVCLQNGTNPENPSGRPSLDEPTFTDLEPREAGTSGDGYIWKYLYTIKPSEVIKFESTNYIPTPNNWETNTDVSVIRENATLSGQIKIVTITNRGSLLGTPNTTYTRVPIKGNGTGGLVTIRIGADRKVESITVSNGGSGYTYGTIDLTAGGVPDPDTGGSDPSFDVIIPPQGGHGYNIYRELGAYNVMIYSRIENDEQNPDFITGNQISRIGIVKNPQAYNSDQNLNLPKASALNAVKLIGNGYDTAIFTPDSYITQTIGIGSTAIGRVVSYDKATGVLKYSQDKTFTGFDYSGNQSSGSPLYGYNLNLFTSSPGTGGSLNIVGGSVTLQIDSTFGTIVNPGISTVINSRTYYLGQSFVGGVSFPEVKKYSGDIIYVDNRSSITRSSSQKEDIKVILQF